jgi:hypothetical protein
MANPDSVGQFTLDSFGNGRIGYGPLANVSAAANAVVTIPFLSGGLTNSGAVSGSGSVILRRITANSPTGNVSTAYVTITTSADGNTSTNNVVVANVALANLTAVGRFQDLTIAQPYLSNTSVAGSTTQALYVNVTVGSGGSNTVNFAVYGDVVSF